MATTETRPAIRVAPAPAVRYPDVEVLHVGRAPATLGLALGIAIIYAAFANGAVGLADESRLQVFVAAIAMPAVAALLFGRGLVARLPRRSWIGLALLAGFAAWCGLSILWSIAPDESWVD